MASKTTTTIEDLPFIIITSQATPDQQSRKLIRSHVMRGKNKGKTYRERRTGLSGQRSTKGTKLPGQETKKGTDPGLLIHLKAIPSPKNVGTDLSFCQVADESIETPILLNLFRFTPMIKQVMFLLEPHVSFHQGPHAAASQWAELLSSDAAYLNAVIYAHHFYHELAAGRKPKDIEPSCSVAYKHLSRSLRLLQEKLSDEHARLSDATLKVILTLAGHSARLGQHETVARHIRGVRKIVDLRGGVADFRGNPKLLIEIFRTDIGLALDSGSKPIFFHNPIAEPFLPYLDQLSGFIPSSHRSSYAQPLDAQQLGVCSTHLLRAWDTTRTFCSLLNYAADTRRKIPQETMLNTMASVMYRLLDMEFSCGSLDEAVRLGLLAFCSHVFLQWSGIKLSHQHLSRAYQDCLLNLRDPISPQMSLWLLFTGHISLFSEEDGPWLKPWLRAILNLCGATSWDETRVIMKAFLWIDFAQDETGIKAFNAIREGEAA